MSISNTQVHRYVTNSFSKNTDIYIVIRIMVSRYARGKVAAVYGCWVHKSYRHDFEMHLSFYRQSYDKRHP